MLCFYKGRVSLHTELPVPAIDPLLLLKRSNCRQRLPRGIGKKENRLGFVSGIGQLQLQAGPL